MGKIERAIVSGSGYGVWMERRETVYCEEVEPVKVEIINGENVVWARRLGISDEGYFDLHHIGCDHLGAVPKGESEIQAMLGCSAVQKVLKDAADTAATEIFNLHQILPYFTYQEGDDTYLDQEGEVVAEKFVTEALFKTVAYPEECFGNIRSGTHITPILQRMLSGVADTQMDIILTRLEQSGEVRRHDPLVLLAA